MKEKVSKIKNAIRYIKKVWKNPRARGGIVLGAYFLFFLFIIISLRSSSTNNRTEIELTGNLEFSLEKIKQNNYHYLYNIRYNDSNVSYEGDRYDQKELFTKTNNQEIEIFYNYGGTYLKNINNVWSKIENPYLYSQFREIQNIEEILENAYNESKTEYSDKRMVYTYKITTNSIVKIIDKKNIDIADIPNTLILTTNSNQEVEKVEMDLSSYVSYKYYKNEGLKITIIYSKFGEIEPIEDPK